MRRPKPRSGGSSSRIPADELDRFNRGEHFRAYERLGCRLARRRGKAGATFAVFAPNAKTVSVIGTFNGWSATRHPLEPVADSGVFEGFVAGVKAGDAYKFHVHSTYEGYEVDKADPFARATAPLPSTASVVTDLRYAWGDAAWMRDRAERHRLDRPISIYEIHLGSWQRADDDGRRFLGYRELAPRLVAYVREMGYTHVELLPILEHPFYGSWGYQATGYFAPTRRYGAPEDLMYLIDALHQAGIGVLLDWGPAHFPSDESALGFFDGTYLFEHADPRQRHHPDWRSLIFDFGRPQVRSFLISSAAFWLDKYHVDGLRVDAVASMLYLDFSRERDAWVRNQHGGRENLGALELLRRLNVVVHERFPGVLTIAEESTSWPNVSRPVDVGGLGFGLKWDMGWRHDALQYFGTDPGARRARHELVTFRNVYSASESYVLPLSHDDVVQGRGSLLSKMPGDAWRRFANLRLLLAWMFAQNGKKLLFMGTDFAQVAEWSHERPLDWHLLADRRHEGVRQLVADLNALYRGRTAMHERDAERDGFEWLDCGDVENSVLGVLRRGKQPEDDVAVVLNMTPVPRDGYALGVPRGGPWRVLLDTDDPKYGGSGYTGARTFAADDVGRHGRPCSLTLTLPPLGALFLRADRSTAAASGVGCDGGLP